MNQVDAIWAKDLAENDFVSQNPTYEAGALSYLFEECEFPCDTVGNMTYYVYNPLHHGADPTKKYPILMWFHGATNALAGEVRINYSGAELYASPKYQESMGGGAFIVVPFANEKRLENGEVVGGWAEEYIEPVKALFQKVCQTYENHISKRFVFGQSSGAHFNWEFTTAHPEVMDVSVIIAGRGVPSDEVLDKIEAQGVTLFIAHGKRDELISFEQEIAPRISKFERLKKCVCFFPEWVRNGDGGVASINFGIEMGQHCLINEMQSNLMLDNGQCMDERFPEGMTGWIRQMCEA